MEKNKLTLKNLNFDLEELIVRFANFIEGLEGSVIAEVGDKKFCDLRFRVVCDLTSYYSKIVPLIEKALLTSKDVFCYFIDMDKDDFLVTFEDMNEEMQQCSEMFRLIKEVHRKVFDASQNRADEAKQLLDYIDDNKKLLNSKIKNFNFKIDTLKNKKKSASKASFLESIPILDKIFGKKRLEKLKKINKNLNAEQMSLFISFIELQDIDVITNVLASEMIPSLNKYLQKIDDLELFYNSFGSTVDSLKGKSDDEKSKFYLEFQKDAQKMIKSTTKAINFYSICKDRIDACLMVLSAPKSENLRVKEHGKLLEEFNEIEKRHDERLRLQPKPQISSLLDDLSKDFFKLKNVKETFGEAIEKKSLTGCIKVINDLQTGETGKIKEDEE